jgi:hypothetical protein
MYFNNKNVYIQFSTHNVLRNDLVTGQVNYKGNFEDISLYIQFYS